MRLGRREVRALAEALEAAEKYKPFQVAKRKVMEKYGLAGSRVDRITTALLYKLYRMQGILDQLASLAGLEPTRLPPLPRQAVRLAALLAVADEVGDREFTDSLVKDLSRLVGARYGTGLGSAVERLYRSLLGQGIPPELREQLRLMLPGIIIRRLRLLLPGSEIDEFAKAVNERRPWLGLRVNSLKATVDELVREVEKYATEVELSRVPGHIRYRGSLPYSRFKPLLEGKAVPQDEASAAAGIILAPREGETVVDLCAAPGGKTTHLAELMKLRGRVVAMELYADRMKRLVTLAVRTGTYTAIEPVLGDALRASRLIHRPVDGVLLDPPCSSTGAIAKHPEARWRLTEEALARLAERQWRMLQEALKLLPPGGRLLYTVCSVMPEEGEYLLQRLLETERVELIPLRGPYDESPLLPGTMRAWPHRHGVTGFFYALLEKR